MDESFLVLFFKKEQYSLFEKREPKTFAHLALCGLRGRDMVRR
jgi:hypothetical protein